MAKGLIHSAYAAAYRHMNIICLALIVAGFTAIRPNFLGAFNIKNILTDVAPLLLVSAGLTFVLLLGCIDLSTGSLCSCSCVIAGLCIGDYGSPAILFLMALMGVAAGLLNGLIYTQLRIPTFIVTLCTASIWQCAALLISGGAPKGIPIDQWGRIAWTKQAPFGLPVMFLVALAVMLILYFIQARTPLGKTVFAVGANERAARMMGVHSTRAKLLAFILTGVGASLAGVFYAIKLRSSLPAVGQPVTLMAIAAVVLGGTTLAGGVGSVPKTLIGVLLVICLQNGLNVIAVDAFWQQIVFGLLIIAAIILNADKSGRNMVVK